MTEPPAASGALHFEHLVQVNDPTLPGVAPLHRAQLWCGLVMRAEFPKSFVPWMDDCSIERDGADLMRTLRFGEQVVRDRVHFEPGDLVDYEVLTQADASLVNADAPQSMFRMSMRIEQPGPDLLFVRFTYMVQSADHRADGPHVGAIKEAYRLADIDTVFRIRQLADSGMLDG